MAKLLCLKCLYFLLLYKISPTVLLNIVISCCCCCWWSFFSKIILFAQRLRFLFWRSSMFCRWWVFWWYVIISGRRELILCEFAKMTSSSCYCTGLISPLVTIILQQPQHIFRLFNRRVMMMINIRRLLSPLNIMYLFPINSRIQLFVIIINMLTPFILPLINQLINLINNNIYLMWGKFMQIPLWWHHQKWCDYQFAIKHQSDQFYVIVTILFP